MFRWTGLRAGSLWCELVFGDAREVMNPGYLTDAPRDLLQAMIDLLDGAERAVWSVQLEPAVAEWTLERFGDAVTLISRGYLDGQLLTEATRTLVGIPLVALAESVLASTEDMVFGRLGVSYEKEWSRYPPPSEELARLAERLERARHTDVHGS